MCFTPARTAAFITGNWTCNYHTILDSFEDQTQFIVTSKNAGENRRESHINLPSNGTHGRGLGKK